MACRLEAAHRPFSLPRWLVRVFGAVVQPFMAAMVHARHDLLVGCLVATQLVGDQYARDILAAFEHLAEELLGRGVVPAALHEDIQHIAVLINGTPQVRRLAVDRQKDLIQVPLVAGLGAATAQSVGILLPERQTPLADRFVGHDHAAFGQQFFDIAVAQGKAEIEPHRMADDRLRKGGAPCRIR